MYSLAWGHISYCNSFTSCKKGIITYLQAVVATSSLINSRVGGLRVNLHILI